MNEQDKKILDLYLKSIRKKRIIVFSIIVILIFLAISVFFYLDYRKNENKIESEFKIIEENIQNITTDEMIDNNITIENTTSQTDNSIANETTENSQNNIINEIKSENTSTDDSNVENDQDTNTNEETTSA